MTSKTEALDKEAQERSREDIRACLAFAADRERKMVSVPPA